MKRKENFMLKEEEQILKDTLAICLARLIRLHYKYYKNKKFDTFEQYCNGYTSFTILSEKEKLEQEQGCTLRKWRFVLYYNYVKVWLGGIL